MVGVFQQEEALAGFERAKNQKSKNDVPIGTVSRPIGIRMLTSDWLE